MSRVEVDGLTINYDVQGEGEPLLLIPYTSADHACYAFQLPAYTEHFSCIAIDLPGSGESDKPAGPYSTDGYADQVAAFLGAIGIERAHVAGMSLGAAVGIHLAARHPGRVRSLSLHSGWHATDNYLRIVVEQWRTLARGVQPRDARLPSAPTLLTATTAAGHARALAWPKGTRTPAINGGYLDLHNVRNRNWKPAQLAAGIEPSRLAVAPSSRTRRREAESAEHP
jgi:pimeloyl-ACP methyl ester carboxylesterase